MHRIFSLLEYDGPSAALFKRSRKIKIVQAKRLPRVKDKSNNTRRGDTTLQQQSYQ